MTGRELLQHLAMAYVAELTISGVTAVSALLQIDSSGALIRRGADLVVVQGLLRWSALFNHCF